MVKQRVLDQVRTLRWVLVLGLVLGGIVIACERPVPQQDGAESEYYSLQEASPEGTGRYYMGREIARPMGASEADWLERPEREHTELPGRLVRALGLSPSDVVADIGAGTGYLTFRLSKKVPRGKVFAVDIEPEMLETIHQRVEEQDVQNVEPVQGTVTDPNLPERGIDLALIVDAYHEFSHPREMKESIYRALRPGGQVVVVEYRGEDPTLSLQPVHTMTEEQVREEFEVVGFEWRETRDILPQQHFVVFEKPVD